MRAFPLPILAFPVLILGSICLPTRAAEPEEKPKVDLAEYVLRADLFQVAPDAFMAEWGKKAGFRWVSNDRQMARSVDPSLVLGGVPLVETLFEFDKEGKLTGATLSTYTRGDAGSIAKPAFGERIKAGIDAGRTLLKTEPVLNRGDNTRAVNVQSAVWKRDSATIALEWSFTREMRSRNIPFRGEFVRFRLRPPERELGLLERSLMERAQQAAPTKVNREPTRASNGDVVLDSIPMVDQGAKGYCVVAAAERVLRFYERPVDQHELASIANSSAALGTTPEGMLNALKALVPRFKVRVRTHFDWDVRGFIAMVEDYNREARKAKRAWIQLGQMIDLGEVYRAMDSAVLKEARLREKADLGRFQRDIRSRIDAGIPLLWSVVLGVLPEEKTSPQAFGGHMRLIIGYNDRTRETLYSDSWGAGHECKRMTLDDAWVKTTGLYSIETF